MAVAVDATNTPAVVSNDTASVLTTASFTPQNGSLIVVLAALGVGTALTDDITISDNAGGLDWRCAGKGFGSTSSDFGVAAIWFVYVPTSISLTVSTTFASVSHGRFMQVQTVTGADPIQVAGYQGHSTALATSVATSGRITINTTVAGSLVFGISDNTISNHTFTPVSGTTTQIGSTFTVSSQCAIAAWKSSAVTVTPGSVTLGGSWSSAAVSNVAAFEVMPLGWTPPPFYPVSSYTALTATGSGTTRQVTWQPRVVGDVIFAFIQYTATTALVTAMASANATWFEGLTSTVFGSGTYAVWVGVATSTASQPITLTTVTTTATCAVALEEFTSRDISNPAWSLIDNGHTSSSSTVTSIPCPSLTGAAGELYWAALVGSGVASPGSSSGFAYSTDGEADYTVWNGAISGTVSPTIPQSSGAGYYTGAVIVLATPPPPPPNVPLVIAQAVMRAALR